MSKKYVIEDALLSCQYGNKTCELKPWDDRHIFSGEKGIASECDIGKLCCKGTFGSCRSPFFIQSNKETRNVLDQMKSLQQLALGGIFPCEMFVQLQWQNTKDDVFLGGYKALLEDGWTICGTGLGIISLVDSGQEEEIPAQEMLERLEQLNDMVDTYMSEHNISPKKKAGIMDSVLLWNGYLETDTFWDYKSNEINRGFCSYLEKTDPHLFNYFERGLYIQDGERGPIDLGYMMGINKALNESADAWDCVSQTMIEDRGMYNGYLEACQQERGKSSYDSLTDFLKQYNSPDYDGYGRYKAYVDAPVQEWRDRYCVDRAYDPDKLSVEEQNMGVLRDMISGRIQSRMPYDEEKWYKVGNIAEQQAEKASKVTDLFLKTLEEDTKKGE